MSSLESLKQPVTRSREFLEECWAELKKVHWPSRKEVQAATLVVVIGVVIVGVYLGAVDLVLTALVRWVLSS
jgi:preprotein translocase subunit SecE